MSYWVYVEDPEGNTCHSDAPLTVRGGTYAIGNTALELNVTYNYSKYFYQVLEGGLRSLNGLAVVDTVTNLRKATEALAGKPSNNYWDATEGNAKAALEDVLKLAEFAPKDSIWRIS